MPTCQNCGGLAEEKIPAGKLIYSCRRCGHQSAPPTIKTPVISAPPTRALTAKERLERALQESPDSLWSGEIVDYRSEKGIGHIKLSSSELDYKRWIPFRAGDLVDPQLGPLIECGQHAHFEFSIKEKKPRAVCVSLDIDVEASRELFDLYARVDSDPSQKWQGFIKRLPPGKLFGFIELKLELRSMYSEDIFFHKSDLGDLQTGKRLVEKQEVEFTIVRAEQGPRATNVLRTSRAVTVGNEKVSIRDLAAKAKSSESEVARKLFLAGTPIDGDGEFDRDAFPHKYGKAETDGRPNIDEVEPIHEQDRETVIRSNEHKEDATLLTHASNLAKQVNPKPRDGNVSHKIDNTAKSRPRCPKCGSDVEPDITEHGLLQLVCVVLECGGGIGLVHEDKLNSCPVCSAPWKLMPPKTGTDYPWYLACSDWNPRWPASKKRAHQGKHRRIKDSMFLLNQSTTPDPTPEQQVILDYFKTGQPMVIRALAGTGKTTTLRMLAEDFPERQFQYVVFNSRMAADARLKFAGNVRTNTAHSIARSSVRDVTSKQLKKYLTASELAEVLGCEPIEFTNNGPHVRYSPAEIAEFARQTVFEFCKTIGAEITTAHISYKGGVQQTQSPPSSEIRQALDVVVLRYAQALWGRYSNPNDDIGHGGQHGVYMKRWQLSKPLIDREIILFDEAQDADPLMSEVVLNQPEAHLVFCGDSFQSIYEWRGAVDALDGFVTTMRDDHVKVEEFWITESHRFGLEIASEAQRFLDRLGCDKQIQGVATHKSYVDTVSEPNCILCRTNREALEQARMARQSGLTVFLTGNLRDTLTEWAKGARDLQAKRWTHHSWLRQFSSWNDVVAWAEHPDQEENADASIVQGINRTSPREILELLATIADTESDADVTVGTVHQAKGLEWDSVRLASDFKHPDDFTPKDNCCAVRVELEARGEAVEARCCVSRKKDLEELRLVYVAVTRARVNLDLGDGLWNAPRERTTMY